MNLVRIPILPPNRKWALKYSVPTNVVPLLCSQQNPLCLVEYPFGCNLNGSLRIGLKKAKDVVLMIEDCKVV